MSFTLRGLSLASGLASARMVGGDREIKSVTADSRAVTSGALWVAMPSARRDTHEFLPDVASAGASAVVVREESALARAQELGLDSILVTSTGREWHQDLAKLIAPVCGNPGRELELYAVTGTNGKTSTAIFLAQMMGCQYMGTLGYGSPDALSTLENTTPFPVELQNLLGGMARGGARTVAMEVSSHALEEARVAGLGFDVSVLTHLSQDHLDYHGTMEAYAEAKRRLFTEWADVARSLGKQPRFALNISDPYGAAWLADVPDALTYGTAAANVEVNASAMRVNSMVLDVRTPSGTFKVRPGVGGVFHRENFASAIAARVAGGASNADLEQELARVTPVRGRFEPVPNDLGLDIIVDYAHTPDALTQLLRSVRALQPQRIIAVFGCGGDRDRTKRPKMAAAVASDADLAVVTSDNPRTEDPHAILQDVVGGIPTGFPHEVVADRPEAIARAVALAQPGDIVVIAGKGHEDYQIIGHTKYPMDDRDLVRAGLEARR
jgi:UDP-N-acetylmuramoyl-L-alanyl-D-glutamate--2,6-diaminopimelate ligase